MKVTAMISDDLINEIKKETGGKNITDSITIALKEYLRIQKLNKVYEAIDEEPLAFNEDFAPYGYRNQKPDR